MSRRQPSPPSHLTRAMVVRHLKAAGHSRSRQVVDKLTAPGRALEAELWDGTLMIPRWRVMAWLDAQEAKAKAKAQEPEA